VLSFLYVGLRRVFEFLALLGRSGDRNIDTTGAEFEHEQEQMTPSSAGA
jgi:hypothetical protein